MSYIGGIGNNTMRISGLATGMDTDAMIKQMMDAEKFKLDKINQDKQLIEWRQEAYRDIIKDFNDFKNKYFDVLSDDYILSPNAFSGFDITNSASEVATATAVAGAQSGTYTVTVNQLAESAQISKVVAGSGHASNSKLTDLDANTNKVLSITLSYGDVSNKVITLDNSAGDKTISDLINEINKETSGEVIASFSELTGKFTMKTSKTGASESITVDAIDGDLSNALNINALDTDSGQDASIDIMPPGEAVPTNITKSINSFTIDGVSYSLSKTGTTDITIADNVNEPLNKIKGFVEEYNKLIDKISDKIGEKKNYSYKPLTEEQKKDMTEDEINKWEIQAKKGIVRSDNTLKKMLSDLRGTFFDSVSGTSISFGKKELGLDTSSDITERGKLKIVDENKLKEALRNNPQQVMDLFTKQSDTDYSRTMSNVDRATRYAEEGILQRINDILNDNMGERRDTSGRKGYLLELAGMEDDITYFNNTLTKQIEEKNTLIYATQQKLINKENRYYAMFARLEQSMNQMNAQSNWLYSQMGTA